MLAIGTVPDNSATQWSRPPGPTSPSHWLHRRPVTFPGLRASLPAFALISGLCASLPAAPPSFRFSVVRGLQSPRLLEWVARWDRFGARFGEEGIGTVEGRQGQAGCSGTEVPITRRASSGWSPARVLRPHALVPGLSAPLGPARSVSSCGKCRLQIVATTL